MIQILNIGKSILRLSVLWGIAVACTTNEEISPAPAILMHSQDPQQWDGYISGSVVGADPRHHFISIYKEVSDNWYTLSGSASMQIQIGDDQSWSYPIQPTQKTIIDKIQIFLFPAGYDPPLLTGEHVIPLKLHLAATAKLSIDMTPSEN